MDNNGQRMTNIYLHTKFGEIGQEIAEIYLFMYFQYGGRPPSWILGKVKFLDPVTLVSVSYTHLTLPTIYSV